MYLPKPLYEAKPYLYLLTGILVAITWGFSPFSMISSAALIIGGLFIIYLRIMYRKKAHAAAENAESEAADSSEKSAED
jgi:hypothetical protein